MQQKFPPQHFVPWGQQPKCKSAQRQSSGRKAQGVWYACCPVAKGVMVIPDEPSPQATFPSSQQDICPTQNVPAGQQKPVWQPVGDERLTLSELSRRTHGEFSGAAWKRFVGTRKNMTCIFACLYSRDEKFEPRSATLALSTYVELPGF